MFKPACRKKTLTAFTLIELLVVIAIIAILLTIIMPVVKIAHKQARDMVCRSNIKQMCTAMAAYAEENNGKAMDLAYEEDYWFLKLAPILGEAAFRDNPDERMGGVMAIAICPSTKIWDWSGTDWLFGTCDKTWEFGAGNKLYHGSYGINAWLLPDPQKYYQKWSSNNSSAPPENYFGAYSAQRGDVPVLADSFWVDNWPYDVGIMPPTQKQMKDPRNGNTNPPLPHVPERFMWRYAILDRHRTTVNVGFVGVQVDKVEIPDLWLLQWNKKFKPTGGLELPPQ